jgi:nucleotide-binding universal stress UspA family protein
MIRLHHVLVATDFGRPSEAALTYGRALARTFGSTLHLMHVVENDFLRATPADPRALAAAAKRTLNGRLTDEDWIALRARAVLEVSDSPAQAIADYARRAAIDLIVLGTHGRGVLAQLLVGSVAERVVRTAPCPVLTVRHPEHEFVSPDCSEQRGSHDSSEAYSRCN